MSKPTYWNPGDSLAIVFSDRTANERTSAQLDAMVDAIQGVADEYGFKWATFGSEQKVVRGSSYCPSGKASLGRIADALERIADRDDVEVTGDPSVLIGITRARGTAT